VRTAFLCLVQSATCQAQTVNVSPGANLQALVNQHPSGTIFSLATGTYRLQSIVPKDYDVFMGHTGALLSGAAILTAFTPNWAAQAQVTQAASYQGNCNAASPACMYPEDLFFDNVPKTRVTALAAVAAGTWYLDYSSGKVYMSDNPTGHAVEISLLPYAFTGTATSVTVSNLIVEKYACMAGNGAIDGAAGGTYWSVGGNEVRYNHCTGTGTGDGMYIYNNYAHHNGQMGIGGHGSYVFVQNNEIAYTNYSGYSYYWEAGGAKFDSGQNLNFRYNYSHNNNGPGFWTDINYRNVLCQGNQFTGNLEAGVSIELSNNATVANNYIWNDGFNPDGPGMWWGGGILISDSAYTCVYFNQVINCMNGIGGILAHRGNRPNGQPYLLQNVDVNSNTITQGTGLAAGIVVEGTGWDNSVYTTWNNSFLYNTYNLADPTTGDYFY